MYDIDALTTVMNLKEELDKRVEFKHLTCRKHPMADLWIYNYTPVCQFEKIWDEYTMMARGLILDAQDNVVARPFKKFFNLGEHQGALPSGTPEIYEKFDGSLGILYWIGDDAYIATRGSFESEQAIKGTELLKGYRTLILDRTKTYLFEIIYPDNRIVVDYGSREDLVLLAVIDTQTGVEEKLEDYCYDFPFVSPVEISVSDLGSKQETNKEGFVLKWANGFRLKYKFDEYVRLHRILTGFSERRVWELLKDKTDFGQFLDKVPDEFYQWIKDVRNRLNSEFLTKKMKTINLVGGLREGMTRKEHAAYILENGKELSAMAFKHLDGKDYDNLIWDSIYPPATKPFKLDIDS